MIENPNIDLILECCKEEKNTFLIEKKVKQIKDWNEFISLAYTHGIFPTVYLILKRYKNLIPEQIISSMKFKYMNILKQNMLMTSELLKIISILNKNNIEAIPFKGPMLSQLIYGDVISRQYLDLDILIKSKEVFKCAEILKNNRYRPNLGINYLHNNLLIEIGSDFSFFAQNNTHVELHWNLFRRIIDSKFIIKYDIWKNKTTTVINNNKIYTLELNIYLLYLSIHGSKHLWERIEWVSDLNKILNKYKDIDWNYLLEFSKELNLKRMFLLGILMSHKLFNTQLPISVLNEIKKDKIIERVSLEIHKNYDNTLFENDNVRTIFKKFTIIALLQDSFLSQLNYLFSSIFKPTHYDIYFFNLEKKYFYLYYFLRPIRFLIKRFKKN